MPAIPQSEVLANIFEEIGEKCGEILAKFFADFRPSISRGKCPQKFHGKSSTSSTVHQIKLFHCCNSGGLGAQERMNENKERKRKGKTKSKEGLLGKLVFVCLVFFLSVSLKRLPKKVPKKH